MNNLLSMNSAEEQRNNVSMIGAGEIGKQRKVLEACGPSSMSLCEKHDQTCLEFLKLAPSPREPESHRHYSHGGPRNSGLSSLMFHPLPSPSVSLVGRLLVMHIFPTIGNILCRETHFPLPSTALLNHPQILSPGHVQTPVGDVPMHADSKICSWVTSLTCV